MARFLTALALLPTAALAFCPTQTSLRVGYTELGAQNAQDQARSAPKWTQKRRVYNDDFDAPVLADPQSGTTVLESAPVVDDECYMGANGQLDECADFDPPLKKANRSTNVMDTPKGKKARDMPKWATYNDDFDAPVLADPQSGTTVLADAPVVDDECYMGANGQLDECADFDPPKQVNLWTNVLDTPAGKKQRDLPKWAKKS
ncbi:hypothetical protein ACHAXM_001346 [Skeletonema potamos]